MEDFYYTISWYPCDIRVYEGVSYICNISDKLNNIKTFNFINKQKFKENVKNYLVESYKINDYSPLHLNITFNTNSKFFKNLLNEIDPLIESFTTIE